MMSKKILENLKRAGKDLILLGQKKLTGKNLDLKNLTKRFTREKNWLRYPLEAGEEVLILAS